MADLHDATRSPFGLGSIGETDGRLPTAERETELICFASGVVDVAFGLIALLETIAVETGATRAARDIFSTLSLVTVHALIEVTLLSCLDVTATGFDILPFSAAIVTFDAALFCELGASWCAFCATVVIGSTNATFAVVSCSALSRAIAGFGDTETVFASLSCVARGGGLPDHTAILDVASLDAVRACTTGRDSTIGLAVRVLFCCWLRGFGRLGFCKVGGLGFCGFGREGVGCLFFGFWVRRSVCLRG